MTMPAGVTVLVTDERGRELGAASDFAPGSADAQEARATAAAWWDVFEHTCRREVATIINQGGVYFDHLCRELQHKQGWRQYVVRHGGPDE